MKIAIPTKNNLVDSHFGNCEYYTIVNVNEAREIETMERFDSPKGCGCKSNVATTLKEMGVETLLAGNMGQGAVNKISQAGIEVVRGCEGDVRELAEAFVKDGVADSGETCDHTHGDSDHQCSHN